MINLLKYFSCVIIICIFVFQIVTADSEINNKVLSLDGVNNLLEVQFDLNETPIYDFTISVLVKPNKAIGIPHASQENSGPPATQRYLIIPHYNSKTSLTGICLSVGSNGVVLYEKGSQYGTTILSHKGSLTKWTSITLVYKNNQSSLYINGSFVTRGEKSKRKTGCVLNFIGGSSKRGLKYSGLIDDFALWNRALTSNEIKKKYHKEINNMDSGLVLYYNFNRTNGDGTINDNSNNGHKGLFVDGAKLEDTKPFYKTNNEKRTELVFSNSDLDSIPNNSKIKRPDGIAIIIGIEKYKNAPPATFAKADALTFEKYANKLLGIPSDKIYTITDEAATLGEFMKLFGENGYLKRRTNEKTDIFIYYSGHGAPDLETKMPYLIPSDVDPDYPTTGYSTKKLYENLGSLNAKSITIFLDACFSGATRSNEMLLANARPVRIEWTKSVIPENLTVMTASSGAQISSGFPKEGHGLFSYYLMKGFQKFSDKNLDSKITIEELYNYVKMNVSKTAGQLDREQTPELFTKKNSRILVEY